MTLTHAWRLPRLLTVPLVLALGLAVQPATPASAAARPSPAAVAGKDAGHVRKAPLAVKDRPPVGAAKDALRRDPDEPATAPEHPRPSSARKSAAAAAAACSASDFTSRSGSALVQQIKSSTTDCVNTLFSLSGTDAYYAFRETQMTTVAYALRDGAVNHPGDNSTGLAQLVLYLRAGYYVQWYDPATVGTYGQGLKTAIQSGLDTFFAASRAFTVSDANGEVLAEAITLIDSAQENDRYLNVVIRMLNGYNSSYNAYWWMLNAVNNVYTVLFRGHYVPAFVTKVQSDPTVLNTLRSFAVNHLDLLGTDNAYLTSNAGRELGRFLQHTAMQATVRPMAKDLLGRSAITGPYAALWVGVAEMADAFDKANCAYYDVCDLQNRLAAAVLKTTYTCSSSIKFRAQDMTATQLADSCKSLTSQDAYFHGLVNDGGRAVAGDGNTTIEVCIFDSSTDYQTYAGAMFGIDTNNGGMYLEGDPAATGNQPRFIAYEAEWVRPTFEIWNLNHEYTHYLDGRFDMYGDFNAGITTPTIWWIEGFAEYVSYSYRKVTYDAAITEAAKRTYALSALWDTTYSHDTTRIYRWGYLAVRYMFERHPSELSTVLGYYRTGNWSAARSYLTSTIGSRYDSDWWTWLAACAAGACAGGGTGNQAPVARFTYTTNGLAAAFTDASTDSDGTIAARRWNFGDGGTSTAANPTRTYAAAGTYTVQLTVTDNGGASATTSQQVTVTSGGSQFPECTAARTDELGRNCQRSGLSATTGNYKYFYLNVPAGTQRLVITSSGGTGNADLYYSRSSWATTTAYSQRSAGTGNAETLTIANPPAGYNYISLYATQGFSGATIRVEY
ncbi:protease [Sphaerisporangium krabiense]|uniref:microbial collagenase n=1 Tax=Sphaerisporangium krabiense TaxID=763782 RepID=A0A7W8Z7E4_9ACTN|nr:collagenase [Sphaerisporangium krabiense]MBB5628635.1 microbial collagenase [Sphaerisporangium krabiense]GII60527.1 protease [Sphaerisporangium krabiense]